MSVQTKSWDQVGKQLDTLGTHLRRRFDEANDEAAQDRAAFEKAVHVLFVALDDTVETASKIVRDPVLHHDLTALAVSLREAIQTTLGGVRERLPIPPAATCSTRVKAASGKATARTRTSTRPATHHTTTAKSAAPAATSRKSGGGKKS